MIRRLANPFPTPQRFGRRGWVVSNRTNIGTSGPEGSEGTGSSGTGEEENEEDQGEEEGESSGAGEAEAYKTRMQAADRAKRAAEEREAVLKKRLQEIEDKDKSDLEVANRRLEEATKTIGELQDSNRKLRLENSFSNISDIKWRKPASALKLAIAEGYFDELTAGDDGQYDPKQVEKKVREFAKAYPEMTITTEAAATATGGGVGGGKPPRQGAEVQQKVKKKYGNLLR